MIMGSQLSVVNQIGNATRLLYRNNGTSSDETDGVPSEPEETNPNTVFLLYMFGIIVYFYDLGTDINVCSKYYINNMMPEFYWTLTFLIFPMAVISCVSGWMYYCDRKMMYVQHEGEINHALSKGHFIVRMVMLLLQMTTIWRTIEAIYFIFKYVVAGKKGKEREQKYYDSVRLKEDSDLGWLQIIDCYLEAAPQMVLQITILLRQSEDSEHLKVHQILTIIGSFVSMGWCEAAYQRSQRMVQKKKYKMDWWGSGLLTLWHFLFSMSRVLSLAAVASLSPTYTVVVCSVHILLMFVWNQFFDVSPFCSQFKIGEVAFSWIFAFIYLFKYILPKDVPTKFRYLAYYTLYFAENFLCACLWYFYSHEMNYTAPLFALIIASLISGIIVMCVYYMKFHPNPNVRLF